MSESETLLGDKYFDNTTWQWSVALAVGAQTDAVGLSCQLQPLVRAQTTQVM